jgi:hypothetical protein
MKWHSGEVNTSTRRAREKFFVIALVVAAIASTSCGGDDRRADRLWRAATERVEKGDTSGAIDRLQEIVDKYPDSAIAPKAREQLVVYKGLASAVQRYPSRRARETLIQLARAIESYRKENGRAPVVLEALAPGKLASIPVDPWGHPYAYAVTPNGYRLICWGSDGAPGGVADAEDQVVVNGEFAAAAP